MGYQWHGVPDPDLAWFAYFVGGLVEFGTISFTLAYFARLYESSILYFISGVLKFTIFPFSRLIFMPYWCLHFTMYQRNKFQDHGLLYVYYCLPFMSSFIIAMSFAGCITIGIQYHKQFFI